MILEEFSNLLSRCTFSIPRIALVCHRRFDNGSEYLSNEFRSTLNKHGILQQLTCPYTPNQNGVAKKKNCSTMFVVRCLLHGMNMPKTFWYFASLIATYLLNRTSSRVVLGKHLSICFSPIVLSFPLFLVCFGVRALFKIIVLFVLN